MAYVLLPFSHISPFVLTHLLTALDAHHFGPRDSHPQDARPPKRRPGRRHRLRTWFVSLRFSVILSSELIRIKFSMHSRCLRLQGR